MKVLVAYASRHGATRGIAERIARTLEQDGLDVSLQPAERAGAIGGYDAFVIGSAAYASHWLKEASSFVRRHRAILANRPAWLFSSGPIGPEIPDAKGRQAGAEARKGAEPAEFTEFAEAIRPRDERVFFGAYDPDAEPIGFMERLGARFTRLAVVRDALPAGDFRDWPEIEAWAVGIALELQGRPQEAPTGAAVPA